MGRFIKFGLPACLWAILIFALSSLPRVSPPPEVRILDKIYHFVEFFIFGYLLVRAFLNISAQGKEHKAIAVATALGIFWGISDEIHQAYVPGRDASALDVLADVLGVLTVAALVWWRRKKATRTRA